MAADPRSLNGLLYSLGVYLRDARRGSITTVVGGSPNLFNDTKTTFADSVDRWRGSEVWFEDTTGTVTFSGDAYRVVASATSGMLTLDRNMVPTGTPPLGVPFVLQNLQGEGWPHHLKLEALLTVLRDQGVPTRATVTISAPDTTDYWNAIPAGIDSVYRVEAVDSTGRRTVVARPVWKNLNRVDRSIYLPFDATGGMTYAIYGRVRFSEPAHATAADFNAVLPQVQPWLVVRKAAEWLMSASGTVQDQRVVQGLYGDRMRAQRSLPLAGEVFLTDWQ